MLKHNKAAVDFWNGFAKKQGLEIDMNPGRMVEWKKIRTIFNITPENNPNIIELGIGVGFFALNFLKQGFNVTGVDISQECLKVCQQRANLYGLNKNLNLVLFDFRKQMFENQFDAGYLISSFHCLSDKPKEQEMILKNFIGSVKKDGMIFIMEPNPCNPIHYLASPFLYGKNWREGYSVLYSSSKRLKRILKENGIINIKRHHYGFMPTRWMLRMNLVKDWNEFLCRTPLIKEFSLFNLFTGTKL